MNQHLPSLQAAALAAAIALAAPAAAKDVMKAKTVGAYRVELHVLPAEPFYTADEIAVQGSSEETWFKLSGEMFHGSAR
jgi:hypothetical protein